MTIYSATILDRARYPRVAEFLDRYAVGPGFASIPPELNLTTTVRRAAVATSPFTVATIDDFLPGAVYRSLLNDWAAVDLQPVQLPGSHYVGSRQGARLPSSDANQLSALGPTWRSLLRAARAAPFVRALFTRFAETAEANLARPELADVSDPDFVVWANQDEGEDEALGAHLDGDHKILTIVLYLDIEGPVTPGSPRLWGTTLYDSSPGAWRPVEFSPNASHTAAGHVEFRPNRAFVMPNSETALHGVAGGQRDVIRRSVMWGYWYRPISE